MMSGLLLYHMSCNHIKRQDPNLPQPILSHYTNIGVSRLCTSIMIQVLVEKGKYNNPDDFQKNYDDLVYSLQINMLECSGCHKSGCLVIYGRYTRHIRLCGKLIDLSVQRVRCKECGKTHAILISVIVPYSQILLPEQQEIVADVASGNHAAHIMERNPLIDSVQVRYIMRQFRKHWEQRILSLGLNVLDELTIPCFRYYSRQFMQVHRVPNILYEL